MNDVQRIESKMETLQAEIQNLKMAASFLDHPAASRATPADEEKLDRVIEKLAKLQNEVDDLLYGIVF